MPEPPSQSKVINRPTSYSDFDVLPVFAQSEAVVSYQSHNGLTVQSVAASLKEASLDIHLHRIINP